jgi:NAD+ kinase
MTFKQIGILTHPERPTTEPVAEQVAASLRPLGIEVWIAAIQEEPALHARIAQAELVVAIGGDGVMLRAARLCARYRIPVLGLNMGKLGFLTEIATPDDWQSHLERLLSGQYWIEQRMMLSVTLLRNNTAYYTGDALNDVVLSGDRFGRMIQLETYIDGTWTTTYNSDALIIATPTGSTAYALAVGGPIMPPQVQNILVVPAAAHLSMDRPIVLSEGSPIEIHLAKTNRHTVIITLDGAQAATLDPQDVIQICTSQHTSRFLRMRDRHYFYRSLLDRLEPRINRNRAAPDETSS